MSNTETMTIFVNYSNGISGLTEMRRAFIYLPWWLFIQGFPESQKRL